MLSQWVRLGSVGSSRWVSFFADGDGKFRPKIKMNGEAPAPYGTDEQRKARWTRDEYRIDFDEVAGDLRRLRETKPESPIDTVARLLDDPRVNL